MSEDGPLFEFIYDYVSKEDFLKYMRLVIVVSVYIMFRGFYQNWAKNKQLQRQVAMDEQENATRAEQEQRKKDELESELVSEEKQFGWGRKTRANEKRKAVILEEALQEVRERNQSAYDAQEDSDIEDLLED